MLRAPRCMSCKRGTATRCTHDLERGCTLVVRRDETVIMPAARRTRRCADVLCAYSTRALMLTPFSGPSRLSVTPVPTVDGATHNPGQSVSVFPGDLPITSGRAYRQEQIGSETRREIVPRRASQATRLASPCQAWQFSAQTPWCTNGPQWIGVARSHHTPTHTRARLPRVASPLRKVASATKRPAATLLKTLVGR